MGFGSLSADDIRRLQAVNAQAQSQQAQDNYPFGPNSYETDGAHPPEAQPQIGDTRVTPLPGGRQLIEIYGPVRDPVTGEPLGNGWSVINPNDVFEPPRAPGGGAGGAGRTQFASERALEMANVARLNFQSELDRMTFEEERANARYSRAADKLRLMQATDQLADERRTSAMEAFEALLPYAVQPGTTQYPGMEPGGPGQILAAKLGANIPQTTMPTFDVGSLLNAQLNAPTQVNPQQIESLLAGLL